MQLNNDRSSLIVRRVEHGPNVPVLPLRNVEIDLAAISVVGPSWAWREGLRALIEPLYPHVPIVMYSGESLPDARAHGSRALAALLDGAMEPLTVMAWAEFCKHHSGQYPVLVIDVVNDVDRIVDYVTSGISGYTLLGEDGGAIAAAIEDLRRGVARCSPEVTARLFTSVASSRRIDSHSLPLTHRELTVLRHIAADCTNQEIADNLMVELCTVKHHVHRILQKLEVRTRWEAARIATAQGWLAS